MKTEHPILAFLVITTGSILLLVITNWIRFLSRGWKVRGHGRDEIEYVERGNGGLVLYAELMGKGLLSRIVSVPGKTTWDSKVPDWAKGRRDEIIGRIKTVMPEPRCLYKDL